ncbi:MAG: hypothetical protein KFH98_01470 [Gemmatimonadetes bacterium]|nr:hypothetical protein [Gemmatimonadota bacterium]
MPADDSAEVTRLLRAVQAADALVLSAATIDRELRPARAWLHRELLHEGLGA